MDRDLFIRWLNRVYATDEAEIDCNKLEELLPLYVDAQVAELDIGEERAARIRRHLFQCPDCNELYNALYLVASLEAGNGLPDRNALEREITSADGDGRVAIEKELPLATP